MTSLQKIHSTQPSPQFVGLLPFSNRRLYRHLASGGAWSGDSVQNTSNDVYSESTIVDLPFKVCLGGLCSGAITVDTDPYIAWTDDNTGSQVILAPYSEGSGQEVTANWPSGVFYRVTGARGRQIAVISWYTGNIDDWHELCECCPAPATDVRRNTCSLLTTRWQPIIP